MYNEDITIIEIIDNDDIPEDIYLEPDLDYEDRFNKYENRKLYLVGYPRNSYLNDKSISSGKITRAFDNKFEFISDSVGSSGNFICNDKSQVIGIYSSKSKDENIIDGTFIEKLIETLNKKKNNNNNYIIAEIFINTNDINKDVF